MELQKAVDSLCKSKDQLETLMSMPTVLIIPPHVTTYLYNMGYKTQEDIIKMVSNLLMNGR